MKSLKNIDKKINREEAKQQGFFDGRFRNRVVPDKKKKQSRTACRNFKLQLN